jgi:tRNA pseudouridine55 synthase
MIQNIYKPRGVSSFFVVKQVKKRSNIKKVGHAGTLDPLAEGVLVILTGDDTKKQDQVMKQDKEYIAEVTFGITTATYDMEFTPTLQKEITLAELQATLPKFFDKYTGEFEQKIPHYSAKKVEGKALYKLARANSPKLLDREFFKKVRIDEIKVLSYGEKEVDVITENDGETEKVKLPYVELKVTCSHGTYLRSLAYDLGQDLGTGATLTKLVRTKVGNFSIENAIKLEEQSV